MNAKIISFAMWLSLSIPLIARDSNSEDVNSKTFFSVNPQYTVGSPEHLCFYHDRMKGRDDGIWGCVEVTLFGGKTVASEHLARYFMPFGKTCLTIAEGPDPNSPQITPTPMLYVGGSDAFLKDDYDLLAQNFNIQTVNRDFQSMICFEPSQSFAGIAFNYRQAISDFGEKGFWFDITVPVIHVKNDIGLEEVFSHTFSPPVAGHPGTMIQALNQSAWEFGKISPCPLSKTGFSDIEMRLGYDTDRTEFFSYGAFVGVIFPAGNRPKGKHLFEPIIGRNGHWGVLWGSSFLYEMWRSDTGAVHATLDAVSSYMFERTEVRAVDLKDKQWSRYINLFLSDMATEPSPGINTLTMCLKVRPKGMYQINSGLIFTHKGFECELGFHLLARQSEEIQLKNNWVEGPGIAGVNGASGGTLAQSMSFANMNIWNFGLISPDVDFSQLATNPANNIPLFKPIAETDLDLHSASHPATIAHKIYGGIAYNWIHIEYPTFIGFGATYQFSADNTSMLRWSAFGKLGVSV